MDLSYFLLLLDILETLFYLKKSIHLDIFLQLKLVLSFRLITPI